MHSGLPDKHNGYNRFLGDECFEAVLWVCCVVVSAAGAIRVQQAVGTAYYVALPHIMLRFRVASRWVLDIIRVFVLVATHWWILHYYSSRIISNTHDQ